jgi:hypothetical protein
MFYKVGLLNFQNKPLRFVQRLLFLSLLGMVWFLGSVMVIQIDYESRRESLMEMAIGSRSRGQRQKGPENQTSSIELENLSLRIDSYCRHLEERKALLTQSHMNANEEKGERESSVLEIAKREKLIRDTLLYFPGLNQMWCLVPKVPTQT